MVRFNTFIHTMSRERAPDQRLRLCVELATALLVLLTLTCAGISPSHSARAVVGGFGVVFGVVLFCLAIMWDTNTPMTLRWAISDWTAVKYVSLREVNLMLVVVCVFVSVSATLNFVDGEPLPLAFGIMSGITLLVVGFFITLFGRDVFPIKVNDNVGFAEQESEEAVFIS